jgi:hypothetical protein
MPFHASCRRETGLSGVRRNPEGKKDAFPPTFLPWPRAAVRRVEMPGNGFASGSGLPSDSLRRARDARLGCRYISDSQSQVSARE